MKKTQQERLEKRILNLINKDLKFLEKKVVEKDCLGEIKFPVITKENKSMEVLEEEGLQIIADALSTAASDEATRACNSSLIVSPSSEFEIDSPQTAHECVELSSSFFAFEIV